MLQLLDHLASYGEVSNAEMQFLGGNDWKPVLVTGGFLWECGGSTYSLAQVWLDWVGGASKIDVLRAVFFSYPTYRQHLIGMLAQCLLEASRDELYPRLESWITGQIPHLAAEIAGALDEVEAQLAGQRLLDAAPATLATAFQSLPERRLDFAAWDQVLLGISGSPEAMFTAVLDKFGSLSAHLPSYEAPSSESCQKGTMHDRSESYGRMPALLPRIPLCDEDGRLHEHLTPSPWNVQRSCVQSSLPLFDVDGAPLFDTERPPVEVLQDALFMQPFYRVIIHLAVDAMLARRSGEERLTFLRENTAISEDVAILAGGRRIGAVATLLPALVNTLGLDPIPPQGPLEPSLVAELISNLVAVGILTEMDGELRLADAYTTSLLNPPRLQTAVRGVRAERGRLVGFLIGGLGQ